MGRSIESWDSGDSDAMVDGGGGVEGRMICKWTKKNWENRRDRETRVRQILNKRKRIFFIYLSEARISSRLNNLKIQICKLLDKKDPCFFAKNGMRGRGSRRSQNFFSGPGLRSRPKLARRTP